MCCACAPDGFQLYRQLYRTDRLRGRPLHHEAVVGRADGGQGGVALAQLSQARPGVERRAERARARARNQAPPPGPPRSPPAPRRTLRSASSCSTRWEKPVRRPISGRRSSMHSIACAAEKWLTCASDPDRERPRRAGAGSVSPRAAQRWMACDAARTVERVEDDEPAAGHELPRRVRNEAHVGDVANVVEAVP